MAATKPNARECVARLRVAPFLICAAVALEFALVLILQDAESVEVAAQLLCVTPLTSVILLWAGHPFRFCGWWKAECLLPAITTAEGILAHYDIGGTALWFAGIAAVLLGSIANGVLVFTNNKKQ